MGRAKYCFRINELGWDNLQHCWIAVVNHTVVLLRKIWPLGKLSTLLPAFYDPPRGRPLERADDMCINSRSCTIQTSPKWFENEKYWLKGGLYRARITGRSAVPRCTARPWRARSSCLRPRFAVSRRFHVIPRERTKHVRSRRRADEPAIVALLQHQHLVALGQRQLVLVGRRETEHGAEPAANHMAILTTCSHEFLREQWGELIVSCLTYHVGSNVKNWPRISTLGIDTYRQLSLMRLSQPNCAQENCKLQSFPRLSPSYIAMVTNADQRKWRQNTYYLVNPPNIHWPAQYQTYLGTRKLAKLLMSWPCSVFKGCLPSLVLMSLVWALPLPL